MQSTLVPRHVRRQLAGLMHQQCWCWGCDIRRACGNLLIDYGARRAPSREAHVSAYHLRLHDGSAVSLWGFGAALVPQQGRPVLLGRYLPYPQHMPCASDLSRVWTTADLPPRAADDTAAGWWTVVRLVRWISAYEAWVLRQAGSDWRTATTQEWEATVVPGAEMARRWSELGGVLERAVVQGVRRGCRQSI